MTLGPKYLAWYFTLTLSCYKSEGSQVHSQGSQSEHEKYLFSGYGAHHRVVYFMDVQ